MSWGGQRLAEIAGRREQALDDQHGPRSRVAVGLHQRETDRTARRTTSCGQPTQAKRNSLTVRGTRSSGIASIQQLSVGSGQIVAQWGMVRRQSSSTSARSLTPSTRASLASTVNVTWLRAVAGCCGCRPPAQRRRRLRRSSRRGRRQG
jgi:hypothetical protein